MTLRPWRPGATGRTIVLVAALSAGCLAGGTAWAQDADSDGVPDAGDNCIEVFNPSQRDDSGDGIGDICDPDFDDDGIVGVVDYTIFRASFQQTVPPAPPYVDMDDDGHVGASDAFTFLNRFGDAPGPAAAPPAVPVLPGLGGLVLALALGTAPLFVWRARSAGRSVRPGSVSLVVIAAFALTGQADPASAQTQVTMKWISTTGAGVVGGTAIDAAPGDVLVAEIRVVPDAGKAVYASVSLSFDTDLVDELDVAGVDTFQYEFDDILMYYLPGPAGAPVVVESDGTTPGEVRSCTKLSQDYVTARALPFTLCTVQFTVTANVADDGADVAAGFFVPAIDAVVDDANAVLVAPAVSITDSLSVNAP